MNKKVKCTLQNALYNGHVAVHKPRHIYVGSGMHNRNQLKGINDWDNPKTTMPSNIRKHNLDPVEYLCDVFCRIKKTAKDKLVDLLAHRWQLATVTSWA